MNFVIHRHKEKSPSDKEKEKVYGENTVVRTRLGFLISIAGALAVLLLAWAGVNQRLEAEAEARKELAKSHEATVERVKVLERAMVEIATLRTDVGWIRDRMAEDRSSRKNSP